MEFSDQMKLKIAKRELQLRKKMYPLWVNQGKIKQEQADYEIAGMQAIVDDYESSINAQLPLSA